MTSAEIAKQGWSITHVEGTDRVTVWDVKNSTSCDYRLTGRSAKAIGRSAPRLRRILNHWRKQAGI